MDKYRGENIFIYAPDGLTFPYQSMLTWSLHSFFFLCRFFVGSVTASTALEGNIDITAASVQCQLIHSNNASIHTTNAVKLKAVYSNKLSVSSVDGPISVDMMQGNAEVIGVCICAFPHLTIHISDFLCKRKYHSLQADWIYQFHQ